MQTNLRLARKKLVPAMDSETPCPHRYSDEEGLVLEIECHECQGAFDMGNRRCMTGIMAVLSSGPAPESVVLRRSVHRRYRGRPVASVASLATELSALNRASASAETPSDKGCRTCAVSMLRTIARMRKALIDSPATYAVEIDRIAHDTRTMAEEHSCVKAARCAEMGLATSTIAR
jgi:hypothetical protein